jgi:hypothetical protein
MITPIGLKATANVAHCARVMEGNTPYPFASPDGIAFLCSYHLGPYVLGRVDWLYQDRVLLSPVVCVGLSWSRISGQHHATVIHELTHLHQMRRYGVLWGVLNLPGIRRLLTERQAIANEQAVVDYF